MSKQGEESEKDLNEFATNVCRHVVDLKKKTKRISILRKKSQIILGMNNYFVEFSEHFQRFLA